MLKNARVADSHFEGLPIGSLKNLPTEFYFPEDDTPEQPEHVQEEVINVERYTTESEPKLEFDNEFEFYELGNLELPISTYRQEILDAVKDNLFTIITAPTGCGKSTQLPQYFINTGYKKVYETQPRIVAAREVAGQITRELNTQVGEVKSEEMVIFRSAHESKGPRDAMIEIVTDGLQLVVELNTDKDNPEEILIIDEAHEWNNHIEILIGWAKKSRNRRVVVTSATMDSRTLADYFSDAVDKYPPIIEVEGRSFPVEFIEKPDSNVVEETLKIVPTILAETIFDEDAPNGILVFLPGLREINEFMDEINRRIPPELADKIAMNPLYSKLSAEDQQKALKKYAGKVNIIPATNVAQTSLTIGHVGHVVDPGLEKRVEMSSEGVECLSRRPISQADCLQRAGRTGRVGPGYYIQTKLNNIEPYIPYNERELYPVPEILRSDIMRNTLRVAALDIDISDFDIPHKLEHQDILRSQYHLRILGAFDENNKITKIGKRMNAFPLSPATARMMVEAELKGYSKNVKTYLSVITASLDIGGLQLFGPNIGRRWKELTEESNSDPLVQLDLFIAIQNLTESVMHGYDLDTKNIQKAKDQNRKIAKLVNALEETELLKPTLQEREELKNCIYAGMVNHIYKSVGSGQYVSIHGSDTVRDLSKRSVVRGDHPIVFANPYGLEIHKDRTVEQKQILQNVTTAVIKNLGNLALNYDWDPKEYTMRNGMFVQVKRKLLYGFDLGIEKEFVAEPSPKLREAVIAHVLGNPGKQQKFLREIKKETIKYSHLAKYDGTVDKLTDEKIMSLILEAAPADIADPSLVDDNLRKIIYDRGISLDYYVSESKRQEIIANAPEYIVVDGVRLNLTYKNHVPIVKEFDHAVIASIKDTIKLNDDRVLTFIDGKRPSTQLEIKEKYKLAF